MKTLLILFVFLSAALSITCAAVGLAENVALQPEDSPPPKPELKPVTAPQAAFIFDNDDGDQTAASSLHHIPDYSLDFMEDNPSRFQFCLEDWLGYNGNCYFIGHDATTWRNAESFCSDFQANLASARDVWEYNFIQRMVRSAGHKFVWIGGYHFENEWRWQDGSKFDYHRWESRNPTDNYQCLQLDSETNKGWTNDVCSNVVPFVCKSRPNC